MGPNYDFLLHHQLYVAALSEGQITRCRLHTRAGDTVCAHVQTCTALTAAVFSGFTSQYHMHTLSTKGCLHNTFPLPSIQTCISQGSSLRCALVCEILPRTPRRGDFFPFQCPGLTSIVIFPMPGIIVSFSFLPSLSLE